MIEKKEEGREERKKKGGENYGFSVSFAVFIPATKCITLYHTTKRGFCPCSSPKTYMRAINKFHLLLRIKTRLQLRRFMIHAVSENVSGSSGFPTRKHPAARWSSLVWRVTVSLRHVEQPKVCSKSANMKRGPSLST